MAIDWLKSSTKQRVDLYDAVVRLIRLRELSWAELYEKALHRAPNSVGTAFNENFRKGKISKANAALIYQFLKTYYPDSLPSLNATVTTASAFWQFLLDYRRLGALEILPEVVDIPQRINKLGPEWREFLFEAGDPILFRLRLPQIYQAVCAINGGFDGWYPIALAEPQDYELADVAPPGRPRFPNDMAWKFPNPFIKPVTQGSQTIPSLPPTDQEQKRRRGENFFVLLASEFEVIQQVTASWEVDKRITNGELDSLTEHFLNHRKIGWSVAQLNAHGMGQLKDD